MCLAAIPLVLVRMIGEMLLEEKSYLLLIDLYIFISLVFSLFPFGPEYGIASHLDAITQKSSKAYRARFQMNLMLHLLNLFLLLVSFSSPHGRKVMLYFMQVNEIRLIVHTCKFRSTSRLEKIRNRNETDGQERLSNETGEMIEASWIMLLYISFMSHTNLICILNFLNV